MVNLVRAHLDRGRQDQWCGGDARAARAKLEYEPELGVFVMSKSPLFKKHDA
jgi:hypothetical protein